MKQTLQKELASLIVRSRTSRLRTMREFAEQEIIVPDGPYQGRRFSCDRQPFSRLWMDSVSSGKWNRFVATGPTQSGKTLCCFLIPLLYHLFEVGETVICGLPDMDMAADKWREDLLPVIERSRYRELMPVRGSGSRGGKIEAIQFLNGATLKFMSGGGGDKSRAGFTSRVVVITETDGMDKSGVASREADKVTQLEARTRAYGARKRIYLECTVSTQDGRTWQEYREGTASQILLRCPHCRDWVSVERQQLRGWQDALSQAEARRKGAYACPNCGMFWTENDRRQANVDSQLVHEGQEITAEGAVTGDPKETETLGFRWSSVHNLFQTAGDVAADEWKAARSPDEDNAEREMRQFVWCLPVVPNRWEETALQAEEITRRVSIWPPGVVPPGTEYLTAAMDLGKYLCHWIIVAWQEDASGYIVDYGRLEVASEDLGLEPALLLAMQEFSGLVRMRLPMGIDENEPSRIEDNRKAFDAAWIDAGYMTETVYKFCRNKPGIFPAVGRGATQISTRWDHPSNSKRSRLRGVGEGYTGNDLLDHGVTLLEVNADHWMRWVHQRLTTPLSQPGAMRLFQAAPHEHLSLAKHLTAERKIEEFVAGKGMVTRWERIRKNNHWFRASLMAPVLQQGQSFPSSGRSVNRQVW
ncbi:terminase gpA endonuclease subunit [Rubinisphaera margarita]|uniref:terminase gpA endonuclease subunit n=1 Tax=Rubinisphaera margarita TaxID=2909586 RepID=UPI001EE89440|nr:terminase gpA endonuclease subunit [Rubinisphaera margarita]MCG6158338.1 phage terminase large subunit family protein [Rubinisphaera margarita]